MPTFANPMRLKHAGILGINKRNSDYVMKYNKRKLYPLVDDKLQTKQLALDAGIAVPKLYTVIKYNHQLNKLESHLDQYQDVVIKPAHGSGGNGILVINGKISRRYKTPSGNLITANAIKHYISNILSGMYSLGGVPDRAFLEYLIEFDPIFDRVSFKGVPDIRIIVFQGIPIAAMVRLPTSQSNGKANLHQGAIGVGINLSNGFTTHGVIGNTTILMHPDTGNHIEGIQIPRWNEILEIAVKCADTVGLGYLGVDIVLDRTLGPLMLELNARPGLNVQLANQRGLLKNLKLIENVDKLPVQVDQRIAYAQSLNS